MDSITFAILFTDAAAYTTHVTVGARKLSVVLGHTFNSVYLIYGNELDYMLGADLGTFAAACTFVSVYRCHAVFNCYSIEFTNVGAASETETAVGAELISTAKLGSRKTVGSAVIDILAL